MYQAYGNTRVARRLLWVAGIVDAWVLFAACCAAASGLANLAWLVGVLVVVNAAVLWYAYNEGAIFELLLERTWKAVCGGIGFVGEKAVLAGNPFWVFRGPLVRQSEKKIYPKLRDVRGDRQGWTGIVTPFAGQTIEDYSQQADAFALAFHVPFVHFDLAENGLIRVRCGAVQVPATYEYSELTQRLDDGAAGAPVRPSPLPPSLDDGARASLLALPMALDFDGNVWSMPIEGQHLLVAGTTGSGKSNFEWSLVFGLENARRAGLVRLYGCDPKRVELALGRDRDWFDEYADTVEDIVELLEKAIGEMFERAMQLKGKARKFTPSPETPLVVIIIDELGYVSAMVTDKKLKERAEKAIATILALGRAVGYSLVGAAQDPRKETVGFRDLFPFRVALGLPAPMVDLVLGDGMHEAGALCEQIPLGQAGAGCGYVISEENAKPMLVRCAWCSDEAIKGKLDVPSDALVEVPGIGYPEYERGYVPQLDFDGKPLGQFRFRVE